VQPASVKKFARFREVHIFVQASKELLSVDLTLNYMICLLVIRLKD
jgi:hypothetical protein